MNEKPSCSECIHQEKNEKQTVSSTKDIASSQETKSPEIDETLSQNKKNNNDKASLITPLVEAGITSDDIEKTIRVLNAIGSLKKIKKKKRKLELEQKQQERNDDVVVENEDGLTYYRHSSLRSIRKALGNIYEHLHKKILYNGISEEEHYRQMIAQRTLKRRKMAESSMQKHYLNTATLRKERLAKLEKLKSEADPHIVKEEQEKMNKVLNMMIPDGAVDETNVNDHTPTLITNFVCSPPNDANIITTNDIITETQVSTQTSKQMSENNPTILPKLRSCYVCKIHFRVLHHFYDQLCPSCASLNYEKRHASVDLTKNYIAIVTGARIKIGFQTCLKLLRAGAIVIATTRFPNSAVQAYMKEKDSRIWSSRLHLYGLDLRDVIGIEAFVAFVAKKYGKIDIIINNACQTVRRPVGYYRPVVEEEMRLWNIYKNKKMEEGKILLMGCQEYETFRRKKSQLSDEKLEGIQQNCIMNGEYSDEKINETIDSCETSENVDEAKKCSPDKNTMIMSLPKSDPDNLREIPRNKYSDYENTGICHSALMSQTILVPDDANPLSSAATAVKDVNNQALDIRRTNSWVLKLEQISTPEILETLIINAVAPFILNSRLIPLMMPPTDLNGNTSLDATSSISSREKFIINVSAMEGKFYRYKMPNHPHTNMAKAALNMMTRTSSEDLAKKYNIYMNSVDTGWINDENPLERASKTAKTNHFQTPIDEIDAAARILDPIFSVVGDRQKSNGGKKMLHQMYGKFFKDYKESEW